MCKKTERFFNVLLAPARKCVAFGEKNNHGRNARTPGSPINTSITRRTCAVGDTVAPRWQSQLHCARRCSPCTLHI